MLFHDADLDHVVAHPLQKSIGFICPPPGFGFAPKCTLKNGSAPVETPDKDRESSRREAAGNLPVLQVSD
jgi:hypothetical protein